MSKFSWFPKKSLGKISLWLALIGIVVVYGQYWVSLIIQSNSQYQESPIIRVITIILGLGGLVSVCISAITSLIAIIKDKERAVFIFMSAIIGILGFAFLIGEFLFSH